MAEYKDRDLRTNIRTIFFKIKGGPMKHKHLPVLFFIGVIMAVLYGCGGGGGGGSDVTINAASPSNPAVPVSLVNPESQACVPCHAAAPAGGSTAQSPAALYSLSLHNTENQATCVSCHQTTPGHSALDTSSKTPLVTNANLANPDLQTVNAAGTVVSGSQCLTCHTKVKLGLPHFNNDIVSTSGKFVGAQQAQYVDGTYDRANVKKCTACHTSHDASKSSMPIFKAYAESKHGDVRPALADGSDARGEAWVHYRWKETGVADASGNKPSSRASCQRCHSTSGFLSQILDITATGTTRLARGQLQFDASGSNVRDNTKQVLRCDACHDYKDFKYNVRDASASLTATYTDASTWVYKDQYGNAGNAAKEAQVDASGNITFPNVSKSNLCINCHGGRENGYSIKKSTANFTNVSFINSHYLAAASVLFRTGGYRYDDVSANLDYADRYSFRHRFAGSDTANLVYDSLGNKEDRNYKATTGDGGPCVSCHMYPVRHTFSPVTKDKATGKITNVNAGMCTACHTSGMSSATLEEEADDFNASMEALKAQLAARGYYFYNAHPYFYTDAAHTTAVKNWASAGDPSGNITGKHNMGAAFNYNLLKHEPGAYTHNRRYTKRLIWDSIDWLDDNTINLSTVNAINALAAAGNITLDQQTKAKTYLGSTRP